MSIHADTIVSSLKFSIDGIKVLVQLPDIADKHLDQFSIPSTKARLYHHFHH